MWGYVYVYGGGRDKPHQALLNPFLKYASLSSEILKQYDHKDLWSAMHNTTYTFEDPC